MSKHKSKSIVLGLDIGSRCIKAVELDIKGRIRWASIRYIEPLVYHRSEVINRGVLVHALTELIHRRHDSRMELAAVLPATHLQMRIAHVGLSDNKEYSGPSEIELKYSFLIEKKSVMAAGEILGHDQDRGCTRVLQAVVSMEAVEELSTLISDAGFHAAAVSSPLFTLPEIFPHLIVKKSWSLFLDAGFESTTLALFNGGEPVGARSIGVGLSDFHKSGGGFDALSDSEHKLKNARPDEIRDVSAWREYLGKVIEGIEAVLNDFDVFKSGGVSIMLVGGGGSLIESFLAGLSETFSGKFEIAAAKPRMSDEMSGSGIPGEVLCFSAAMAVWEVS